MVQSEWTRWLGDKDTCYWIDQGGFRENNWQDRLEMQKVQNEDQNGEDQYYGNWKTRERGKEQRGKEQSQRKRTGTSGKMCTLED